MAFGGEMHHDFWPESCEDLVHAGRIYNVRADEGEARIGCYERQRFKIAGVGQLVDDEHRMRRLCDDLADNSGADETGAAGHEDAPRFAYRVIQGPIHGAFASKRKGVVKSRKNPSLASFSDKMAELGAIGQSI